MRRQEFCPICRLRSCSCTDDELAQHWEVEAREWKARAERAEAALREFADMSNWHTWDTYNRRVVEWMGDDEQPWERAADAQPEGDS